MSDSRPPDPYQFLRHLPTFQVTSVDVAEGQRLNDGQVFNGWGQSGGNLSPQLSWSGFPAETKSFAVSCYDPDAPTGSGFWHWTLFDIPVSVTTLPTGAASGNLSGVPAGAVHARNDFGNNHCDGAAPPPGDGPHRYMFVVHAVGADKLGADADTSPAVVGFMLNAND